MGKGQAENPKGKSCGNVWDCPRIMPDYKEATGHPTQKPEKLADRILSASSRPGGLVLVPFAGSGTEIVSCIRKKRDFIAAENNPVYVREIILPRIEKAVKENADERGGVGMNRKLLKVLDEIDKTEAKIAEWQGHLASLHEQRIQLEEKEIIRGIRAMNLPSRELAAMMDRLYAGDPALAAALLQGGLNAADSRAAPAAADAGNVMEPLNITAESSAETGEAGLNNNT